MRKWNYIVLFLFALLLANGCKEEKAVNTHKNLQLSDIEQWTCDKYKISPFRLYTEWDSLCSSKEDNMAYVDGVVKSYYSSHRPLKWISLNGVNTSADTLLAYLSSVGEHGLKPENFYVDEIKKELHRFRQMDFDKEHTISKVAARLDFYLTRAYFRYASGMKFGFVEPHKLYNSLEKNADSTNVRLYGINSDICGPQFIRKMNEALSTNELGQFLRSVQPVSPQYYALQKAYIKGGMHDRLLRINMERCRWQSPEAMGDKYVLVNIPSQRLWAVERKGDEIKELVMRVCCGSNDSKTPMLDSKIYRVELNPFWLVPRSIIRHGISLSESYLKRKRMRIIERSTGKEVPPSSVTKDALMQPNPAYLVRQDNGEGNSLGRMIFRFQNDFSIFLHDTSDKNAFDNGSRDVSHGCIRVEKPLELALFLLSDKDKHMGDVFRKAITQPNPKDEDGQPLPLRSTYQSFDPPVPLFIHYYTAYPDPVSGTIHTYPDIYHFDTVLWEKLRRW